MDILFFVPLQLKSVKSNEFGLELECSAVFELFLILFLASSLFLKVYFIKKQAVTCYKPKSK